MKQTFTVRGLIIREQQVGESDKYLTIFTKERGKLSVRARGAKNAKSKLLVAQQFAYCDFVLYQGGTDAAGFLSLTQVDLIESFYNLRLDYDRLMTAYDVVKLVDRYMVGALEDITEAHESQAILFALLKTLQALCSERMTPTVVYSVFCLKFLQIVGLAPSLDTGVLHTEHDDIPIGEAMEQTLTHILVQPVKDVFRFTLSPDLEQTLSELCTLLLRSLER